MGMEQFWRDVALAVIGVLSAVMISLDRRRSKRILDLELKVDKMATKGELAEVIRVFEKKTDIQDEALRKISSDHNQQIIDLYTKFGG